MNKQTQNTQVRLQLWRWKDRKLLSIITPETLETVYNAYYPRNSYDDINDLEII